MESPSFDSDKPRTVELVELSQQNEPLLQRKSTNQPGVCQNFSRDFKNIEDHNEIKELPEEQPTSSYGQAHLHPVLTQTGDSGNSSPSSPQTPGIPLYGGSIPKNRKRPGSTSDGQRVTMTGTVTRGNSVGQPVEVQLELTETEFHRLTSRDAPSKPQELQEKLCRLDARQGPHIILWSVLCMPAALLYSLCIAFYNGAMTWYNLVVYLSEEPSASLVHRILLCPLVILSFPLSVGLSCLGVSFAATVMQISWSWHVWWMEFCDGEKGFYGWVCSKVGLPDCSPYQVVVLDDTGVI